MAMGQYQGVNGVARKVTKRYQGVDGVARNITKAYVGVNGVARQYFSSEVEWLKYSTTKEYSATWGNLVTSGIPNSTNIYLTGFTNYTSVQGGTGWGFSETEGLYLTDVKSYDVSKTAYGNALVGKYVTLTPYWSLYPPSLNWSDDFEFSIFEVTNVSSGNVYADKVAIADLLSQTTTYLQGDESFGSVKAEYGQLPEEGTLIEGSATSDYCVIQIGDTYYYYEKA